MLGHLDQATREALEDDAEALIGCASPRIARQPYRTADSGSWYIAYVCPEATPESGSVPGMEVVILAPDPIVLTVTENLAASPDVKNGLDVVVVPER
jgi:hypothetical protein